MDIVIQEQEPRDAEKLRQLCVRYLIRENRESNIIIVREGDELIAVIKEMELAGILFLNARLDHRKVAGRLADRRGVHYIVLVAASMEQILKAISPEIRPSGCLLSPVREKELDALLDALWEDQKETSRQARKGTFSFHVGKESYVIPTQQIVYFESVKKKIVLHTAGQEFEFYDSLGRIESQLTGTFLRVHKSYIVNMEKVEKADYGAMILHLRHDCQVYFSRSCRQKVREWMRGEA